MNVAKNSDRIGAYIEEVLSGSGTLIDMLSQREILESNVFAPPGTENSKLLNFNAGGVCSQTWADEQLVNDVETGGALAEGAIIFFDPWSAVEDIKIIPNDRLRIIGDKVGFLCEIRDLNRQMIEYYRDNSVSYLKIILLSNKKQSVLEKRLDDLSSVSESVFKLYVSVYDDESWASATLKPPPLP